MTEYSFTVTYLPTSTVISAEDVELIKVRITGTGEINSCILRLNNETGRFINIVQVDQFDQFRVEITDEDALTFNRIYEVDKIVPVESALEGQVLEVQMLGQEHYLQKVPFAKQYYFDNSNFMIKDLSDIYNASLPATTTMPAITGHDSTTTNEMPEWTSNHIDFNIQETMAYDAMVQVVNRLGSSISSGGAGDFFELFFSNGASTTQIALTAFSSGSKPVSPITINDTDAVNPDPTEGGIEAETGTVVGIWGADGFGTQPTGGFIFHGILEAFELHPQWDATVTYPQDARVQKDGIHYISDINSNTSDPAVSNWTSKVISDTEFLGTKQYSEWTEDKAALWINSGSNPANLFPATDRGCWDGNMVIQDGTHYRTYVEMREKDPLDGDVQYKYGQTNTGEYRAFTMLADPAIGGMSGVFASNDKNGVAFSGNVAEFDGTDWIVKRETADGEQVGVIEESKVYEKQSGTWVDISPAINRGNDCFHEYASCVNDAGFNNTDDGAGGTYGDTSAVKYTWTFTGRDTILDEIFTITDYYKIGAWANFRVPYPINIHNGITETLGQLWGNNITKKEPVTFDANGMHLSHSGNIGFNHTEAEEFGIWDSLQFHMRFKFEVETIPTVFIYPLTANYKMTCYLYDSNDNVVRSDFIIDFDDHWEQITLPISSFKVYRARLPLRWGNIKNNLVLQSLDILNTFQWKNIKQIVIQFQEVYDDEGRYSPETWIGTLLSIVSGRIQMWIDGFQWTKPGLAVTPPITSGRFIVPPFPQETQISNHVQLTQAALSQLEIEKFRHKEFVVRTEGKLDINFGDSFFLQKDDMVSDNDNSTSNNIKLVAKVIELEISKPSDSPGGFVRTITGVKRFE